MTDLDTLRFPVSFLQSRLPSISSRDVLEAEQQWWRSEGVAVGGAIDRAATPWLRVFDKSGTRTDEILYPREYQTMLRRGYRAGVIWRAFEEKSLLPTYQLIYRISFYDPGVCCPLYGVARDSGSSFKIRKCGIAGAIPASTSAER